MANVLVSRFLHSLPALLVASEELNSDVERIVSSLRSVIVARKLERSLRVHLLHTLQLLCKLQAGLVSKKDFDSSVKSMAEDVIPCDDHRVQSLVELYAILQMIVNY